MLKTDLSCRLFPAFFLLIATLGLASCGPAVRTEVINTPETSSLKGHQRPYMVNGKRYDPLRDHSGFVEQGTASWYGPKFHGRKTSNGETFDMYALTAAHKTLPLGVSVRVTNLNNGRQVVVRVNDRGPFVAGRVIDLSFAAAKQLDMVDAGTAPVRVEALGYRAGESYRQPETYDVGVFAVQVGAFSRNDNAHRLANRLRSRFGSARVTQGVVNGRRYYRVWVGRFTSLAQAERTSQQLASGSFPGAFVVALQ
ncbi:MAG: septal ring lytic transglycosylase RlpA family protein [Deltaproteobacteria bacterium]|nr:MAG: septal ring lytic transglycosylase RlpA family protein [Deltaproteobacteria bacterium]